MKLNLLAPINELSYGVVSKNILYCLDQLGHEISWFPIGATEAQPKYHESIKRAAANAHFFDNAAASLRIYHQFSLAEHVGKGLHCALPIFELNRFTTTELHHLRQQDVVFCPSHWAAQILVENGILEDKIQYAPFGVDTDIFSELPTSIRSSIQTEDATIFLNIGKWELRKGHDVLVDAFAAAFQENDNVKLLMCCFNPVVSRNDPQKAQSYNEQWARLYKTKLKDKVEIIPRLRSQEDVAALMRRADCGVFPSRAEGWNLELAEMLAMGKPCIATNYSGHTEYCTHDNSLLIDFGELEEAFDGVFFNGTGQWMKFGDAQIAQLVEHLRSVHRSKQAGQLERNTAGIETFRRFTWANCVDEITAVLK